MVPMDNFGDISPKDILTAQKCTLLLRMIPLMYKCGGTAHLAQIYIDRICKILDLEAIVTFLPGRILITWPVVGMGEEDHHLPQISSLNVALTMQCRWGFRLSTLQNFDDLLKYMQKNSQTFVMADVMARLATLEEEPPQYGTYTLLFGFGLIAGPMAPAFFGGSLLDGAVTFLIGIVTGTFALLSDHFPMLFVPFHEILCSFVCATLAIFFSIISHGTSQPISFWPVVLASNIWILPGFSLVIATIDILSKAGIIPGFLMFFSCCFVALIIGFSYSTAIWITGVDPNVYLRYSTTPELQWDIGTCTALTCLFAIACCIIYQARLSQWPIAIISMAFCFLTSNGLVIFGLPDEFVHFTTAFLLGIFMRSLCKIAKQIPEVAMYAAMLPLVPGSRIVRASFALLAPLHGADCLGPNAVFYKSLYGSITISVVVAFGLLLSELVFNSIILRSLQYLSSYYKAKWPPSERSGP